jgi:hypothetical protein
VSYDWNIAGATILNGQGTDCVNVRTSSYQGTTYLSFRVRAKIGTSYSNYFTLSGTSDPDNCGGGGGMFLPPAVQGTKLRLEKAEDTDTEIKDRLSYQIIDLSGYVAIEGYINPGEHYPTIEMNTISRGIYILKILNSKTGEVQTSKFKY